ncbi:MAG TPA: DUF3027 domain-containing protein [Nakamurella sp.]
MSFVVAEEVVDDEVVNDEVAAESARPSAAVLSDELIDIARAAAVEEAGAAGVGDYLGARSEDVVATSAAFAATDRGYRGWHWLVTIAVVDPEHPTISEVVLLPGEGALLAPAWVPWDRRVRAGDLGVGDLLPTPPDDARLVPGYLDSDDPAVREVDYEFGFGRVRVLGQEGRDEAAARWHDGPFGPAAPMAQQAPAVCASCGFYIRLEGLLGQAFGACTNEFSPADGRVVDIAYGCGAHSETVVDAPLISATTAAVMDEMTLDVHHRPAAVGGDTEPVVEVDAAEAEFEAVVAQAVGADPAVEVARFDTGEPAVEATARESDPAVDVTGTETEVAVSETAAQAAESEPDADVAGAVDVAESSLEVVESGEPGPVIDPVAPTADSEPSGSVESPDTPAAEPSAAGS